jgi:hypothetical protein
MKPDLFWFKSIHPKLEEIEIKSSCKLFNEWNNFPYRNFPRFAMDFELKLKEASKVWIWIEFDGIWFKPRIWWHLVKKAPIYTWMTNRLMKTSLRFQSRNFWLALEILIWIEFEISFSLLRIRLTNGFDSWLRA